MRYQQPPAAYPPVQGNTLPVSSEFPLCFSLPSRHVSRALAARVVATSIWHIFALCLARSRTSHHPWHHGTLVQSARRVAAAIASCRSVTSYYHLSRRVLPRRRRLFRATAKHLAMAARQMPRSFATRVPRPRTSTRTRRQRPLTSQASADTVLVRWQRH